MKDLLITLLNTAFWVGLHFGTAGAVCALPKDVQTRWFDPNRRFFTVSDWEMRVFRKIGLPKWKDRLPQFNPEFDKRHLKSGRDTAYLDRFLFITCRAEVIHYVIGVLGWVSLTFCLLAPTGRRGSSGMRSLRLRFSWRTCRSRGFSDITGNGCSASAKGFHYG